MEAEEHPTLILLQSLSHPLRKALLEILGSRSNATFTELLYLCGLDAYHQKGLLDYHLKNLSDVGIITKVDNHYMLSGIGRKIVEFSDSINQEYKAFFASKRQMSIENAQDAPREITIGGVGKMKIHIKKLPDASLVIDSFIFPLGERRKYLMKASSPLESPFGDYYGFEECVKEAVERGEECKVILTKGYANKYTGIEENKPKAYSEIAEEGFHLDSWSKAYLTSRTDGIYELRSVSWAVRDTTKVDDDIYDPAWIYEHLPMKAGQKGKEGPLIFPPSVPKEITVTFEWEVDGDYEIKIGRNLFRCLRNRTMCTHLYNNKSVPNVPTFVMDKYYTKGLLKVLSRRWDKLDFMKILGYKNWEESPTMKYKDQVWYLTDETYLSEIANAS